MLMSLSARSVSLGLLIGLRSIEYPTNKVVLIIQNPACVMLKPSDFSIRVSYPDAFLGRVKVTQMEQM